MAQFATGHYQDAVATLSREETYGTGSRVNLIGALALADRMPEAREEARLFLAGNPGWKIADFTTNLPFTSATAAESFVYGWRLAGLPD